MPTDAQSRAAADHDTLGRWGRGGLAWGGVGGTVDGPVGAAEVGGNVGNGSAGGELGFEPGGIVQFRWHR